MTRKGRLTVTGTQWDESGGEQTEQTVSAAEFHAENGTIYILYEEDTADGGEITRNMIKLKGGTLELTKKGTVGTRMVFEPGREHMTLYSTPFGSFPLGVLTDTVESVLTDSAESALADSAENFLSAEKFRICVSYSLTGQGLTCQDPASQGSLISHRKIMIEILFQD